MAKRSALLLLVLAFACGGKQRPPTRHIPQPAPTPPPVQAPAPLPPASAPSYTPPLPATMDSLAPEPRIRVGLSTSARAVRLTSSRPFRIGTPEPVIETQDVLIEPLASAVLEGAVYRVQLRSFPTREPAALLRTALREELDDELVVWREADTGRYALRLGAFPSAAGARARLIELGELGFDAAEVVSEPTRTPRPSALVLRPVGMPAVQTSSLSLVALPSAAASAPRPGGFIEVDGDPYRGFIELFVNRSNTFTVVNVVNLEDYLQGVVPAELSPAAFPAKEAIKAQAIAARTYAIKRRGQFDADGYDICATPACQVYRGISVEQPMATEAVHETSGEVLTYQGKLVDALYTSTCGGRTENAENVFSTAYPYLVSRACFLEQRDNVVRASNPRPLSLETALLSVLGITSTSTDALTVTGAQAREWVERAVTHMGQRPCWSTEWAAHAAPIDIVSLGSLLGEGLCWERRLPFLMSSEDALRVVPLSSLAEADRRHLAFAIREGIIHPAPDGIQPGRALTAESVASTLYRVIEERGEPPLRQGTIERVASGRLFLTDDTLGDDENEISTILAPVRYLYRKSGASTYYASELTLLAGDSVNFRIGDGGVDVLMLVTEGTTFDRSSRLSHWVVRKSNEDLSREVSSRGQIGDIVDLRPKRYGRSGRIVELEIVGSRGSVAVDGLAVRRALGIRENLFFIDAQRRSDGTVDSWVFTGRGWGHGVGMCQVGAFGMASAGYNYRQILSHYYAGTRVERPSSSRALLDVDKGRRSP